jgi:DNA-binding MarR family transcriptional regulator
VAFSLDESIGFLVHRADLALANHLLPLFKPHGLTIQQWKVLDLLVEEDGQTQHRLAHRNVKAATTLVRILDNMQEKGLVERRDHDSDRRAFRVTITDKGRKLHGQLAPLAARTSIEATRGMTEAEVNALKRLLHKIYANMEALRDGEAGGASGGTAQALAPAKSVRRDPFRRGARRSRRGG